MYSKLPITGERIAIMSANDFNTIKVLTDAAVQRQQILSNNLANIETDGYIRQELDFGTVLSEMKNNPFAQTKGAGHVLSQARYSDYGKPITLESEISKLYDNHLRYQLLTKTVSHHYEHLRKALEVRGQ
jgi:flagellar basal-body rod protein FlgB